MQQKSQIHRKRVKEGPISPIPTPTLYLCTRSEETKEVTEATISTSIDLLNIILNTILFPTLKKPWTESLENLPIC